MTSATLDTVAPLLPTTTKASTVPGFVTAGPKVLLRLEGLAMLIAGVVGYRALGGTWGFFAAAFLVPDRSMLGYLAGAKVGAFFYNAAHSLIGPALLAGLGLLTGSSLALWCTLIWVAHIGFDRAMGYGLKYGSTFFDTHLGKVGRQQPGQAH